MLDPIWLDLTILCVVGIPIVTISALAWEHSNVGR